MSDLETIQELQEALQRADDLYNRIVLQLHTLTVSTSQLCADMTVLCEANLAGDVVLVMSKVEQFTQAYKRNRKPVGSVH